MTTRLILLALFLSVVASTSSADFAVTPDGQANNYQLHSPTETELQAHERNIRSTAFWTWAYRLIKNGLRQNIQKLKKLDGPAKYRVYVLCYTDDPGCVAPFYVGITCQSPKVRFRQHTNRPDITKPFKLYTFPGTFKRTTALVMEQSVINGLRARYNQESRPGYLLNKINAICPNNPLSICTITPYDNPVCN